MKRRTRPRRSPRQWAGLLAAAAAAAAAVAAVIYVLIWYGPDVIARHDIGSVTGPLRVFRMQQAQDAARGRLLTLGAGLFAAAALIFTARNSILLQRTVELTEQGQVTDRYTKAIEQIGADKLDVRIGGIYALERLARDSDRDHPTIMEVLAAFVREHSREPWPPADEEPGYARQTRPDVQAAVTVLGRRDPRHDQQRINLTGAELPGADLTSANLDDANLTSANLTGANLLGAELPGVSLTDAYLPGADLDSANLTGAELPGANLTDANLTSAGLTGAALTGADLTGADLTDARWPSDAAVPRGWRRRDDTGRLERAEGEPGGASW